VVRYGGNLFFSSLTDAIENVTLSDDACIRPPCFQLQNVE
jgi:iron complex outermembrane receptor protein